AFMSTAVPTARSSKRSTKWVGLPFAKDPKKQTTHSSQRDVTRHSGRPPGTGETDGVFHHWRSSVLNRFAVRSPRPPPSRMGGNPSLRNLESIIKRVQSTRLELCPSDYPRVQKSR